MKLAQQLKGLLIALLATITFSNVYIFSKLAMRDVNLASFGVLWFSSAIFWNILYNWYYKKRHRFRNLSKSAKKTLLLIAGSELIATSAFFLAIQLTPNPTIVSFLANTSPVFVIIISIIFLKERFTLLEFLGIILTILGVILINYTDAGFTIEILTRPESLATYIFALFYGISLILAKSEIRTLPSTMITLYRNFALLGGFLLYTIYLFEIPQYTSLSIIYISIGSLLGPFLGTILTYIALNYIEASKVTIVLSNRSFFIIIGSFFIMNMLPTQNQFIGGIITIMGTFVISWASLKKKKLGN
ncbi:EamA family transporter [Ancylomarina euxinus]|uniref:EamA family transporter n=1 Tax=Ancylomarina euxinus TaxID=2283627 RepID=A0A425Y8T3_9BACT|nr:DMT family transporter [Ancylomarina euxinus]MCZ4693296.1 DMT family transporter [Ancylomarina euxinus]MUP13523.1 EamA family transporter [Ancylomarina euxinus]RRG24827.1 EamA family transporter [Ancylomarina euxinus]